MKNRSAITNSILATMSYLISVTFTMTFIYGLIFYNRATSGQSTAAWSIIMASFILPGALANIFVGVLSDIYSKKRLMMWSEIIGGVATLLFLYLFSMGFEGTASISFYAAAFSMIFAFYEVPLDASMVNIGKEKANKLVSIIWLSRAVCYLIAPVLGKILSPYPNLLFYLNASSFLISGLLHWLSRYEEKINSSTSLSKAITSVGTELKSLTDYIKSKQIIGFLLILNLAIALVYMPVFNSIIPDIGKELSLSDTTLSFIESSSWLGVSLAAIVVTLTNMSGFLLRNLFNTLKLQSLFFFVWFAPLFVEMTAYQMSIFYIALVVIDGAVNTLQSLGALTYFQVKIPEEIRGKLLGTMRTVMKITAPLGLFIYGIALEYLPWYSMLLVTTLVMISISFIMERTKTFKDFMEDMELT
ncbi:MAG TPA: hypothetical protein DEP20_02080 [Fusobacteria bacterium]|nr:hypothetical protein [Fusobacteriota bacterium]|tara:strand:- start:3809 stop:5056 length:1248 start_codon:yes stop_codon:yes gene_type:complete